ncbi:hypothetical protein [Sulfurimonas sp.]|uniref:hypothetical protein n=1 Tax=Sulfurimonas sp. TaxID=2022749 RepID=UPI003D0F0A07
MKVYTKLIYLTLLSISLLFSGCFEDEQTLSLNTDENVTLKYTTFTLSVEAPDSKTVTALNQTLLTDQNKTVVIKGVDNNTTFYLYNIPLVSGTNEINITATNEKNESVSKFFSFTSDANGSAPIAMHADSFSGVKSLQTDVKVGTLLNAKKYLFDQNGDGIIDEIKEDANFSVNLNQEGRYKPRITILTDDDVLYSSNSFALSLDVKADANQTDPVGAQPVDEAKHFVEALINNDRASVEEWFGHNEKLISYIYSDPKIQPFLAETYKHITSWEQTYHDSGYATVKILFEAEGKTYEGGFEMVTINPQVSTGRQWIVRFFY